MIKGVLLTSGSYYGTLAAARLYYLSGIPVVLADSDPLNFSRFSKAVNRYVESPSTNDLAYYAKWLIDFGMAYPGLFLYPTSDDHCWVIAKYRDKLQKCFVFQYPEFSVIRSILDKRSLYQMAATAGIDVLPSFDPNELNGVNDPRLKYPLILKPRTQAGLRSKLKGIVVPSPKELPAQLKKFREHCIYDADVIADLPDIAEPIIQQFFHTARINTYSMSGYLSADGEHFMIQATNKVLQNPPLIGVGLCFQSAALHDKLAEKIRQFCQSIGYYGVFEVEFLREQGEGGEKLMLMDFNPRFYGQMEFDISRGLPLPLCPIYELLNRSQRLGEHHQQLKTRPFNELRFRHRALLLILLCTQFIGGRISFKIWRHWMAWVRKPGFDPIARRDDIWPLAMDLCHIVIRFVRHPRSSFKQFFR